MDGTMGKRRQLGGLVSGHRFTGRGKTQVSYQGIALAMPYVFKSDAPLGACGKWF
jgi:hypothetical protein